jgi:hypothetical protein
MKRMDIRIPRMSFKAHRYFHARRNGWFVNDRPSHRNTAGK